MIRTVLMAVNDDGPNSERVLDTVAVIRKLLTKGPFLEADYLVVPDEQAVIRSKLRMFSDRDTVDLILTTGGTGMLQKERTPEATREVIEREVPGLAEFMRIVGMRQSPRSILFRGICGIRRKTLIVNLPGGPKGASDSLAAILPSLPPAMSYVSGHITDVSEMWVEK